MMISKTRIAQLAPGQRPEIHAAVFRIEPRQELITPFSAEIYEFRMIGAQTGTLHGIQVCRVKLVALAEKFNSDCGKIGPIAAPANMESHNMLPCGIGKQKWLTIRRLD